MPRRAARTPALVDDEAARPTDVAQQGGVLDYEVILRGARPAGLARRGLTGLARQVLVACGVVPPASLGIKLTSDRVIRRLNARYRGTDRATDVLSFEGEPEPSPDGVQHVGDIAIPLETAERQAVEAGHGLDRELAELILHGCLHVLGHDHETDQGEMDRLELDLRAQLLDGATARSGTGS